MRKIRCMTCGREVDNETHFHCDSCLIKQNKKKNCNHIPAEEKFKTYCKLCNTPLKAWSYVEDK